MRAALACALSVALLAGCKPPIEQGARFKSIGFACTQHQNAVAADSAHASGNGLAVQALLRQGCVMVRLNTEITPVAKSGEYIQFTATPRALDMHMVPGMENVEKIALWTHLKNLKGMEKYLQPTP